MRAEIERTLPRLGSLDDKDRRTLEAMADAVVNKLLHHPLMELKRRADGTDNALLIDATRRLFDLDAAPSPDAATEEERGAAEEPVGELAPVVRGGKSG